MWSPPQKNTSQSSLKGILRGLIKDRVSQQEIILLTKQLSSMLKSGLPLNNALKGIAEQIKGDFFRGVIQSVIHDIESGLSLSEGLKKYPKIFNDFYISMVLVGEAGGILDQSLERLSVIHTKEMNFKTRLAGAMVYPCILLGATGLIVIFLLVGILPKFVTIFESYEAKLPLLTRILLGASDFLRRFWFILLALLGGGIYTARKALKIEEKRYQLHKAILNIPFVGELYLKMLIAQFSRSLGAMVKTGVPLLNALAIAEKSIGNLVLAQVIRDIQKSVSGGSSLTSVFKESKIFPVLVVQMVDLGEKSGKLDDMLGEVATYYDEETEQVLKNVTTALEPLLLLTMGVTVAIIALAVLLPIFNLIKVFKN